MELNANSVNVRPGGEANMKELAPCLQAGRNQGGREFRRAFYHHLGRVEHILNLLREIDFPQELVVNASMETLVLCTNIKKPVAAVMEV